MVEVSICRIEIDDFINGRLIVWIRYEVEYSSNYIRISFKTVFNSNSTRPNRGVLDRTI